MKTDNHVDLKTVGESINSNQQKAENFTSVDPGSCVTDEPNNQNQSKKCQERGLDNNGLGQNPTLDFGMLKNLRLPFGIVPVEDLVTISQKPKGIMREEIADPIQRSDDLQQLSPICIERLVPSPQKRETRTQNFAVQMPRKK